MAHASTRDNTLIARNWLANDLIDDLSRFIDGRDPWEAPPFFDELDRLWDLAFDTRASLRRARRRDLRAVCGYDIPE